MTLIASTLNYKMPFLISDLLWSSEFSDKSVKFPTNIFDPSPYLPNDHQDKPIKLGQKMYIINDKVCIIFAGINDEIIIFLTLFKDKFQSYDNISKDDIHEFLKAYKLENNYKESAFFITHIENLSNGAINVNQFYCPSITNEVDSSNFNIEEGSWNIMHDKMFETVSALGSGTEGFLNIIKQNGTLRTQFEKGDFMSAVQANTTLIAQILTLERVALYTLKENWGGGFETAYYNGNRFEKISEIAYLISHGQFNSSGEIGIPIPMLIMYYKYINDILYIVSLEVNKYAIQETEMSITFTSFAGEFYTTIYEVEGIDLENIYDFELPSDFSFNTNKVSIGYALVTSKNTIFNPAFFNLGPEVNINFLQGKIIEVKIDKKIMADIRGAAREAFSNL